MAASEEYKSSHTGATIDDVVTKFPSHASRHSRTGEDPLLPTDIGAPSLDENGKVRADQASSYPVVITASTTLLEEHMGRPLVCNSSSPIILTIPSGLPADSEVEIIRYGTGAVTVTPASGVTLVSVNNLRGISDQYGSAGMKQLSTNVWLLTGQLG